MRIEELKQGNFIKSPDSTEYQLLNVVNRFFNSDMDGFENSKEAIILEVQKRLKPLIINLVKKIAWEEGREIFEPMIVELVDKIVAEEMGSIKDLIDSMKNGLIKYRQLIYTINSPLTMITLPDDVKVVSGSDVLNVFVNGMQQTVDINYEAIITDKNITSVAFFDTVEIGDTVTIDCWIYNSSTVDGSE